MSPLFSRTTTGLINGVSRQGFALHLDSQGYEQTNCLSNLAKGVTRRPGFKLEHHVSWPQVPSASDLWHFIDRDSANRYLVWIQNGDSTPDVRILNLNTGAIVTPTYGSGTQAYLDTTGAVNAGDILRLLTIGDTTYIVNTSKTPAMESALTASPANYAFVWIKAAPYVDFSVTVKSGSNQNTFNINQDTNKRDSTEAIAADFASALDGSTAVTGKTIEANALGNLVVIRFTDNSAISVEGRDGWGNQGAAVFVNGGKVQNFAELPARAPDGFMLEVEGDPDASQDSYFVRFAASQSVETVDGKTVGYGTWQETVKWGIKHQLDADTMPVVLKRNGSSWELFKGDGSGSSWGAFSWGERTVGDEESAPEPAFVGTAIQDVAFFQNRLGFVVGETVAFSGVDDFHNFFPTTVISTADDDSLSMTANFPEVAKLRYAVPFNDLLVLFSDSGIYGIRGSEAGFSARTAEFLRLTSFTGQASTRPALAGDRIFFTERRDNETILREFIVVDVDGAYAVESVSEHVDDYVAPNVRQLFVDGANNMAFIMAGSTVPPFLWVYQYFHANREKVQSAWHRWSLQSVNEPSPLQCSLAPYTQLMAGSVIDGTVYVALTQLAYGDAKLDILAMPLSPVQDVSLGVYGISGTPQPTDANHLIPFVDYWQVVTLTAGGGGAKATIDGVFGGALTDDFVVLPYDMITGWAAGDMSGTTPLAIGAVIPDNHTTDIYLSGSAGWVGRTVLVGLRYRSTYEVAPPVVVKDSKGGPQLVGRYNVRRMRAHFASPVTVYAHVVRLPKSTTNTLMVNRRLLYRQKASIEFPVMRPLDPTLIVGIHSEQPLQDFSLYSMAWEGDYFPRGGRSA